jgi:hypothetical protein
MRYDEIELCAQTIENTILGTILNTTRKGQCNHLTNKRFFTLTFHSFCTLTPIPRSSCMICECSNRWRQFPIRSNSQSGLDSQVGLADNAATYQWTGRASCYLQMNRLSLRNNWLNFKTSGKLLTILEEIYGIYPNSMKKNWKMSTCNRLNLETLGSWLIMPKNLPGHCHIRYQ